MKKILFIVCTHGDELAGYRLFLEYPYGRKGNIEWKVIVGNPEAMFLNTRYVDKDLNRVCDVKEEDAKCYEEIRVLQLKKIMEGFDVVYDIHTTTAIRDEQKYGRCIFVNNIDSKTLHEIQCLQNRKVIWDSDKTYQKKYVTGLHSTGITLEYEKLYSVEKTYELIKKDVLTIVDENSYNYIIKENMLLEASMPLTHEQREKANITLYDFEPLTKEDRIKLTKVGITFEDTEYYPIFVNTKEDDPNCYCYLNKKIA